jgi:hypothetical protein
MQDTTTPKSIDSTEKNDANQNISDLRQTTKKDKRSTSPKHDRSFFDTILIHGWKFADATGQG